MRRNDCIGFAPCDPPCIALLTDFGTTDGYVGAMRGVIAGAAPHARLLDVAHELPAHDVRAAAFVLAGAARWFPAGTVFLSVVDPGVGTARRPIVVVSAGRAFVGPDNGLFTLVVDQNVETGGTVAFEIDKAVAFGPVHPTFHGRDLFAPAAARLARGEHVASLGRPVAKIVRLHIPAPAAQPDGSLELAVLHVDRFGNVITNLAASTSLADGMSPGSRCGRLVCHERGTWDLHLRTTYAGAAPSVPFALWGSSGYLEISIDRGRAADLLAVRPGDALTLRDAFPQARAGED